MNNFAAIDFETANAQRTSICSVGVVIVRDSKVVDEFHSYIKPYPNYYAPFCQRVHGIGDNDTCDAADFPQVWAQVARKIEGLPLVAHNASFERGCISAAFQHYMMPPMGYVFYDTLAASRKVFGKSLINHQLHTVALACGFRLTNHHDALADAQACAAIALRIL